MKSPIWRVGIIDPDGILNGSTTVTRSEKAMAKITMRVLQKDTNSPQTLCFPEFRSDES
jgi:hypothetical protein